MYQINKMNQRNQMNQINQINLQPEPLLLGNRYNLQVTAGKSGNFSQDYTLAWRMEATPAPVPIPPAAWLFATGVIGLLLATRGTRTNRSSEFWVMGAPFNSELPTQNSALFPLLHVIHRTPLSHPLTLYPFTPCYPTTPYP